MLLQAATPRNRPYYIYDASISYPTHKDTIPVWVSIVVPFVMLLISIIIAEFILMREVRLPCQHLHAPALMTLASGVARVALRTHNCMSSCTFRT